MISALGMGTEHLTCQQSNGPWTTNGGPSITTRGQRSEVRGCRPGQAGIEGQFWNGHGDKTEAHVLKQLTKNLNHKFLREKKLLKLLEFSPGSIRKNKSRRMERS